MWGGSTVNRSWEEDFAVPWRAKVVIRRAFRRAEREVARARVAAGTHDVLVGRVRAIARRFAVSVNRTEMFGAWVETMNRDDLYEAIEAVVREGLLGYRGDLDAAVQAAYDGLEEERRW